RLGRDSRDLVAPQAAQARRLDASAPAPRAGLLRRRSAFDLRRTLSHPLTAVGALRHVRADLGAAVLADDEEVRFAHLSEDTPAGLRAGGLCRESIVRDQARMQIGVADDARE